MSEHPALTKRIVASRLIISAIRMWNEKHDPIAVHAVAASAFSIVRELMKVSGKSYVATILAMVFFDLATSYRSAGNTVDLSSGLESELIKIKRAIDAGEITKPSQINILNIKQFEREALEYVVAPYNFAKHADKDPEAEIAEEAFIPVDAIMNALACYSQLFPAEALPPEVEAFVNRETKIQ